MKYELSESVASLERTPATLNAMLRGLPEQWTHSDEGPSTWSPFDVVGHLIHGEKTDWIPRAQIIIEHGPAVAFESFDRFAQMGANDGRTIADLLDEFAGLRRANLATLASLALTAADLERRGTHPELGEVTLSQLLATWTAHDLGHIFQISRTMARQYRTEVGPWTEYMRVLQQT